MNHNKRNAIAATALYSVLSGTAGFLFGDVVLGEGYATTAIIDAVSDESITTQRELIELEMAVGIMQTGLPHDFKLDLIAAVTGAEAPAQDGEYNVLLSLESSFVTGTYVQPCDENGCEGPVISLYGKTITSLLQSREDGSYVQCHFFKESTDPGDEALLRQAGLLPHFEETNYSLGFLDALRPAPGDDGAGNFELGSCIPYETELEGEVGPGNWPPHAYLGLAMGDQEDGIKIGAGRNGVIIDPEREWRLRGEYEAALAAGMEPFPSGYIEWDPRDPEGSRTYYEQPAGAACENTGDFSVGEAVQRAFETKTPVDVPLRGPCPLAPQ